MEPWWLGVGVPGSVLTCPSLEWKVSVSPEAHRDFFSGILSLGPSHHNSCRKWTFRLVCVTMPWEKSGELEKYWGAQGSSLLSPLSLFEVEVGHPILCSGAIPGFIQERLLVVFRGFYQ